MKKETIQPIKVYIPITRMERTDDGNALMVEGYAYVNAMAGDGWNLKRSSMEKATEDYNAWGTVREMHEPKAPGTATGVAIIRGEEIPLGAFWDDKGAYLRSLICDPVAIDKCERKVYKGYSVGVTPTIARGKDVEECIWKETSLVDRPCDKDAVFTSLLVARADGADLNAAVEVDVYDEGERLPGEPEPVAEIIRGYFSDRLKESENSTKRSLAWSLLSSALSRILYDKKITDVGAAAREEIAAFADYIVPLLVEARSKDQEDLEEIYWGDAINDPSLLTRLSDVTRLEIDSRAEIARVTSELEATAGIRDAITVERDAAVAERDTAKSEKEEAITRRTSLEAELAAAKEEIKRLGGLRDETQPRPVRNNGGAALERTFAERPSLTTPNENEAEITRLRGEYDALVARLPDEKNEVKRGDGVSLMMSLKQKIVSLGGTI